MKDLPTLEERAAAIAALDGTDPAEVALNLARADNAMAIVDTTLAKLPPLLAGSSLEVLRLALVLEEAKQEDARVGAIKMIEGAIDAHPDQVAALANAATPPVDGGPVDLELDADQAAAIAGAGDAPKGPDAIAAAVDQAGAPAPRELEPFAGIGGLSAFDDDSMKWSGAQVLASIREGTGAKLVIAGREVRHEELEAIEVTAADVERASDERVLYLGNIELDGIGLAHPLPIIAVWLVFDTEDGAIIVRRCAMAGELVLEPGRRVAFPPRTLIF